MSDTSKISNQRRCPKCGQPIPAEAPQGLCPKCLLLQASIPTEGAKPQPAPSRAEVAAAFPQLEILELIGQGGMGFVFKARQPKLERLVALKILSRALADDPAFAERFTREARVLARLNHPNIVAIHDFGQAAGFFYLLMEFVDGVNLRQAMRAGRFTPAQALAVVPKICEALQFAHNEGILHRDIKPENILVDTRGRVKIADFGIAKLVGETASAAALTGSGATLGTPHYMAPEQLEKPATVDHRADIYSLGVVFYEMLTGELPLGRFQPPSHKVEMDVRLDEVVLHALEKEPSRRYQQASQVKTAVETIATPAPPPPVAPAPDRFWRRMALAMALLCLTLIVIIAFFARSFWAAQRPVTISQAASVPLGAPGADSSILVIEPMMMGGDKPDASPWRFRCLFPADHLAQLVFVLWSNGVPTLKPGLSSYFKVGDKPLLVQDMVFSCGAAASGPFGGTNLVGWSVYPGFDGATGEWSSNQPPYRKLEIGGRSILHSGRQLAIRLAEFVQLAGPTNTNWSGVEMRVFLQPLPSPPVLTDPGEFDGTNYVAGFGLAGASEESILKMIKELPCEPTDLANIAPSIPSPAASVPVDGAETEPATLVMDTINVEYPGSFVHDASRRRTLAWEFKTLIPARHVAQMFLVFRTDGTPRLPLRLGFYVKAKDDAAVLDGPDFGCEPLKASSSGETNLVRWGVSFNHDSSESELASGWVASQPDYRKLYLAHYRLRLASGHQLVIPLAESGQSSMPKSNDWSGVELRVILLPLRGPAETTPEEFDTATSVTDRGFDGVGSMENALKLMNSLPEERIQTIPPKRRLSPDDAQSHKP